MGVDTGHIGDSGSPNRLVRYQEHKGSGDGGQCDSRQASVDKSQIDRVDTHVHSLRTRKNMMFVMILLKKLRNPVRRRLAWV